MAEQKTLEARLAEIEAKLTFSEDMLEELNRTIYRQQQHIDRLQLELRALREVVDNASATAPVAQRDEMPPHY
jgi:SlyX protein